MGLLDGIEKLINEHGSAAILRERIALVNDKYAALESENTVLHFENEALKFDNSKLQEQTRNLEAQFIQLRDNPILTFDQKTGTWIEENKSIHYCPKCKALTTLSPMKNEQYGWYCSVCVTHFDDPDKPKQKSERKPPNWRTT